MRQSRQYITFDCGIASRWYCRGGFTDQRKRIRGLALPQQNLRLQQPELQRPLRIACSGKILARLGSPIPGQRQVAVEVIGVNAFKQGLWSGTGVMTACKA